jgi:hypothetical protein
MLKSQNRQLILFLIFLSPFTIASFTGVCDDANDRLALADSLFAQKKYTQSFDLYDEIYSTVRKSFSVDAP